MTRRRFRRMVRMQRANASRIARDVYEWLGYDEGGPVIIRVLLPDPRAGRVFRGWRHERPVSP